MIPDYRIIGKRIKNARLAKGMKQEELAEEIDVSMAFLSRIETGRAGINLKKINTGSRNIKCITRISINREQCRIKGLFEGRIF